MPKPKKEVFVQIRVFEAEKKIWQKYKEDNKFPSLSQMVRFAVDEMIARGDKRTTGNNIEKIQDINKLIQLLIDERKEHIIEREKLKENTQKSKDVVIKHKIKGQILKLLEKSKLKSEDIAEIFNIPEGDTIDTLNFLVDKKLIKLNKNMKYEVINNGN